MFNVKIYRNRQSNDRPADCQDIQRNIAEKLDWHGFDIGSVHVVVVGLPGVCCDIDLHCIANCLNAARPVDVKYTNTSQYLKIVQSLVLFLYPSNYLLVMFFFPVDLTN